MTSVELKLPGVPAAPEHETFEAALGRLAIGFSASEMYLALICVRLNSWKNTASNDFGLTTDTDTIFTMFFSVESTRGRRELVRKLTNTRKGSGYISAEWKDKVDRLLDRHAKIAAKRNLYFHTPLAVGEDGAFYKMTLDILVSRNDRTKLQSNPNIRANNAKLTTDMVNRVCLEIGEWIEDTRLLCMEMESMPSLTVQSS